MKLTNKSLAPAVLLITALVLIMLQLLSSGISSETDSICHYQFSRYAFRHPEFFLHHWGKPLFTILSSPFSQLGYTGIIAFNLLCGLCTGWFTYLIARRMEIRYSWVAIIFTVFTPIYLFVMYSGLTEILFSLVLVASIYLFISRRFILSALVLSLLPFARTEGIMFIVLFIPALLWMKQYKAIPFLLTGFVFFGLIGIPQYHDFFWFFNQMPYTSGSTALYGSGSFWTYFGKMDSLMNYPLMILGIAGLIHIILNLKKSFKNFRDIKNTTLFLLVIPSFFGFILAQSFMWWKGMGILASERFIACIMPLSVVFALSGFEWMMEKVKVNRVIQLIIGIYIIGLVVYKPFTYHQIPARTSERYAVMEQLATWLKESPYKYRKAGYCDPSFPFYMDTDPFDTKKLYKFYSFEKTDPATLLKPGELLIWDAHFAGYEGHLPFESVMKNNNLRLMNIFTPVSGFTIFGNIEYKVAIFMKAPRDTSKAVYKTIHFNDFETGLSDEQLKRVSTEFRFSGKQSVMLTPELMYSPAVEDKLESLPDKEKFSMRTSVKIMNPSADEKGQVLLVFSIDDADRKIYKYNVLKDDQIDSKPGEWFEMTRTDLVDRNFPVGGNYKAYIWYTGKKRIYVDDLKVEIMPFGI